MGAAADREDLRDLFGRIEAQLERPAGGRAGTEVGAAELRARLREPLPQEGEGTAGLLEEIERRAGDGFTGSAGPRWFGFVTGGLLPGAFLGGAYALALDQCAALWQLTPAGAEIEWLVLDWLKELFGYPAAAGGVITSGATLANFACLAAARNAVGERLGVDVEAEGVMALPRDLVVYGSDELHVSDIKALRMLGLGEGSVRRIPIGAEYRMRADLLGQAIAADEAAGRHPAIVIGQAGSVNAGSSDPLTEIADLCAEHDLWFHVDGAFGAFFALCERTAHLARGMERADSLCVDGHKWLNVPYGTGFAFVREAARLRAPFAADAAYLTPPEGAGEDLSDYGPESSRSLRGLAVWAAIKSLGRRGLEEMVTRHVELAARLAEQVEAEPGLELTAPVQSNVVCFRARPHGVPPEQLDALNRAVQAHVAAEGEVFFSGTVLDSGYCFRPCIVNWRTQAEDTDAVVPAVRRALAVLG